MGCWVGKPHWLLGKPTILRKHPYGYCLLVFGPFRPKTGPKKGQVVRKGKVVHQLGKKDPSNETNVEASAGAQRPVPEAKIFGEEPKTAVFSQKVPCVSFSHGGSYFLIEKSLKTSGVYSLLVKNRYLFYKLGNFRLVLLVFCFRSFIHLRFFGWNLPLLVCELLVIGLRGEHAVDCFSQEMEPHDFCKLDLMFSRKSTTTAINNTINNTAITRIGTWINP